MLNQTRSIAFLLFASVAAVGCQGGADVGTSPTTDALVVSLGADQQVRLEGSAETRAALSASIESRFDALISSQSAGEVSVELADREGTMRTWSVDAPMVKTLGTEISQVVDPSTAASACVRCTPVTCPASSPTGSVCLDCVTIPCPKPTK